MGSCPPSSSCGFERIFNRIRCVLACCGGQLIVQNSKFSDGEKAHEYLPRSESPASFGGLAAVYRAVKEETKSKVSRKKVQHWLSQQDVYTLRANRLASIKKEVVSSSLARINAQFQTDLCDVQNLSRYNKGYKYLLTCVDIFRKYAWVVAFKTKLGQELVKAFQTILFSGRKPRKL